MKEYIDKNDNMVQDEDYILVDEKVCQALRCYDGTLLYEELEYNFDKGKIELLDNPSYPDAYEKDEVEIISYNKAVKILKTCDVN
jgi:hypothetical protein